jgi:hypothetical protein
MPDSALLFAPLIVLAVVLLMGFVGCESPGPPHENTSTETGVPPLLNYSAVIGDSQPLFYWRLNDNYVNNDPPATCFDYMSIYSGHVPHPGDFHDPGLQLQRGSLLRGYPDPDASSISVDGAYISLDVDGVDELLVDVFTIEMLVSPGCAADEPERPERVVASSFDPVSNAGWMLVATVDGDWRARMWTPRPDGTAQYETFGGLAVKNPPTDEEQPPNIQYLALSSSGVDLKLFVDGHQSRRFRFLQAPTRPTKHNRS